MAENELPRRCEADEETEDGWDDERLPGWRDRDDYVYFWDQRETFEWEQREQEKREFVRRILAAYTDFMGFFLNQIEDVNPTSWSSDQDWLMHVLVRDYGDVTAISSDIAGIRVACLDKLRFYQSQVPGMRLLSDRERRRQRRWFRKYYVRPQRRPVVKEGSENEESVSVSTGETHTHRRKRRRSSTLQ